MISMGLSTFVYSPAARIGHFLQAIWLIGHDYSPLLTIYKPLFLPLFYHSWDDDPI